MWLTGRLCARGVGGVPITARVRRTGRSDPRLKVRKAAADLCAGQTRQGAFEPRLLRCAPAFFVRRGVEEKLARLLRDRTLQRPRERVSDGAIDKRRRVPPVQAG